MIRFRFIKTGLFLCAALCAFAEESGVEASRQSADAVRVLGVSVGTKGSPGAVGRSGGSGGEFGELVVLKERVAFDPWRARVGVQGFHTDNAALAPVQVEDFFLNFRAEVGYVNRLVNDWNVELELAQDFLRYDRFSGLDFDMTSARMGVARKLDWLGDAGFSLSYDLRHLAEAGFGAEIATSHAVTAALTRSWSVGRGQRLLAGLMSQPEFYTVPDFAQRHDHGVYGLWSAELAEGLTLRVLGKAAYRVRPNADRDDWNFVTRATLAYAVTDALSVSASTGVTWNLSAKDRFDYRSQLTGAFMGVDYRF
jgi:hypothetical protein